MGTSIQEGLAKENTRNHEIHMRTSIQEVELAREYWEL